MAAAPRLRDGWRLRRRRPLSPGLERWSDLVLDATHEGVCGVDDRAVITFANPAAARLLRRPLDDLTGRPFHDVVHGPGAVHQPGASCPVLDAISGASVGHVEDLFLRPDGSTFPVDVTGTVLFDASRQVAAVVTFRDITEHHRALDYYGQVVRLTAQDAAQREVVHQLQEAVQPPVPDVAGVDLAVHHLPADPSLPSGGDLYDWQPLPGGDLHVAVVDVLGKGVAATKDALTVVHALRLLVLEGWPMDRLVSRADELLRDHNPDLVATVVVARYASGTGRLQLVGAGHPPALVVSPDGTVKEVQAPGVAIGWPGAGSFAVADLQLGRGDTLLLYTDGLVEARRDILRGLDDLKEAAARTATYPVPHLPRILVDRALAGADRHDDSLALAVRRRVPPDAGGRKPLGPFEHRFWPALAAIPVARHLFGEWLRHQPIDRADADDMLVVASELCTNAVRAASGAPGSCVLRARGDGDAIVIEAEDDGPGFGGPIAGIEDVPEPGQANGRGLFLVQSLVDDLCVTSAAGAGTVVRCTKREVFPR